MTTGGGEEKNPPKIKNPSKIKNLRFFQNTLFLNHFVHLRIPGSLILGCFRSLSVLKYIFTFVLTKVRENGKFSCVYFYVDNHLIQNEADLGSESCSFSPGGLPVHAKNIERF